MKLQKSAVSQWKSSGSEEYRDFSLNTVPKLSPNPMVLFIQKREFVSVGYKYKFYYLIIFHSINTSFYM